MSSNMFSIRLPRLIQSISIGYFFAWVKRARIRICNARMVARQRQKLAQLDSAQLKDIGISHADALAESSRDFWDIPEKLK